MFDYSFQFKALVENKSGHYIKALREDRDGEYISTIILIFFKEHEIHKKFSTKYTPQQNGIAERKNITIIEMARSMMKENYLSNEY